MFFRFGSAIVLVVLISLIGTALEKRNLEVRREISRQHYREDVLLEQHAALRVQAQQLGAPARVIEALDPAELTAEPSSKPKAPARPAKPARKSNTKSR